MLASLGVFPPPSAHSFHAVRLALYRHPIPLVMYLHAAVLLLSGLCALCTCSSFLQSPSLFSVSVRSFPSFKGNTGSSSMQPPQNVALSFSQFGPGSCVTLLDQCCMPRESVNSRPAEAMLILSVLSTWPKMLLSLRSLISPLSFTSETPIAGCTKLVIDKCLLIGWFIYSLY